jgi:hypothetical protein
MLEIPLHQTEIPKIPRIKKVLETLPDDLRICPAHRVTVIIIDGPLGNYDIDSSPPASVPFYSTCCEFAFNRALAAVSRRI